MAGEKAAHRGEAVTRADAFLKLTTEHLDASYRLAQAIVHDPAACTQTADDPTPEPTARATATEAPDPLARVTIDGLFVVGADGRRIAVRC